MLLKVQVLQSNEYEIDGDDLSKSFDVPLKVALFGGKITLPTLYKDITLTIPPNTKNNQKFRIKGKGIKNRKTSIMGDLYLRANIILPHTDHLSNELKNMLQEQLP